MQDRDFFYNTYHIYTYKYDMYINLNKIFEIMTVIKIGTQSILF